MVIVGFDPEKIRRISSYQNIFRILVNTSFISALSVNRPKLKRKLDFIFFSDKSIALRTWEIFVARAEQAEPAETAMPARSNLINNFSAD